MVVVIVLVLSSWFVDNVRRVWFGFKLWTSNSIVSSTFVVANEPAWSLALCLFEEGVASSII